MDGYPRGSGGQSATLVVTPTDRVGATDIIDDAALLAVSGQLALDDGDLRAARHWFDQSYRSAERAVDPPRMAEAVLGLSGIWVNEHRTASAAGLIRSRLEYTLSLLDPDSSLALRLRLRAAAETDYLTGGHVTILKLLDEARASGDPTALTEALSLAHHCVLGPDHGPLRRELADEMIGEGARAGRRGDVVMGLLWRVADAFLDADPHAERRLGELRAVLAEGKHRAIGYVVDAMDVMLALRAGDFEKAEQLAAEVRECGTAAGDEDATAWYGAQLVAIRWFQGRLPELLPTLSELVHSPTLSAVDNSFFAALAISAASAGDRRTAAGALATLDRRGLAELPRSSTWMITMYGVVEASYVLGDGCIAQHAYELLRPYAHLPMMASLGVACFGSVHHALGVASLTVGEVDRAITHLRDAVSDNLALAHWPATVTSLTRLAQALERRGDPGDEALAREQREMAAEMASKGSAISTPPPGPGQAHAASITRHGQRWRIHVDSRSVLVEHSVGMLHLAVLTANPGVDISAIDLAAGIDAFGQPTPHRMSAQPVLDRAAVQRYRQRLAQLGDAIDDFDATGDSEGAARARTEKDWLLAELSAGTGLGGRARPFADNAERARLAVGKSIRRAIARITATDPIIGGHLHAGVHTGIHCWYRPA